MKNLRLIISLNAIVEILCGHHPDDNLMIMPHDDSTLFITRADYSLSGTLIYDIKLCQIISASEPFYEYFTKQKLEL